MEQVQSVTGNIATTGAVDTYTVNLQSGISYSFDVTGQTAGGSSYTLGHPVLKIYAPDGGLITKSDYSTWSGTGYDQGYAGLLSLDPHFGFTAGITGTYTVTIETKPLDNFAYDWDTYLPNANDSLDSINSTGTYKLDINAYDINQDLIASNIGNYRWMNQSNDERGTGATIYYDFKTNNLGSSTSTETNPLYGYSNIRAYNAADQAKIKGWLSEVQNVANVKFVQADAQHAATMHFMLGTGQGGSTGTAWLYNTQGYQFNAQDAAQDIQLGRVDVVVDSNTWAEKGIASGSGYAVFMHELGHALGLKHPGTYTPEGGTADIVNPISPTAFDNTMWSQMSYSDSWQEVNPNSGSALKGLDIAALQTLYGANSSYQNGNTTWAFNSRAVEYSKVIYDTGGIDTLDASGQTIGSVINLAPGSLSSIGAAVAPAGMEDRLAEYVTAGTFGDKAYNNVGIGFGVNIENAKGGAGADYILGNDLNNVIDGGANTDRMAGGAGNDTFIVDNAGDLVIESVNQGTDLVKLTMATSGSYSLTDNVEYATLSNNVTFNLTGNDLDNTLTGNAKDNVLIGGLGDDTLIGGAGNDTLIGSAGTNVLLGGSGNDIYYVDSSSELVYETATIGGTKDAGGKDTVISSISYDLSTSTDVSFIENLTLTGSANNNATGNSLNNVLIGNSGNNILDGGRGSDTMIGGAGNDTYIVKDAGDKVFETVTLTNTDDAGGNDTIESAISFNLSKLPGTGFVENLTLTGTTALNAIGNALDNHLTGNIANNLLDGGAGIDTMAGGAGNDTYIVDNAEDLVIESVNQGTDLVKLTMATSGSYSLTDNVEYATLSNNVAFNLTGNDLDNTLTGNAKDNVLIGGLGDDTLIGGAGNDTLIGGAGVDTLTGGLGADSFVLDGAPNSITNLDTIKDFSHRQGDSIQISQEDFDALNTNLIGHTLTDAEFGTTTSALTGDQNKAFMYNSKTGALFYSEDGTAEHAVQVAIIGNHTTLTASDFHVI